MYVIRTAFQELAVSTHGRLQATCCPNTQRAFPAQDRQSSPLYSCASPLHEIQKISLDPFLLLQLMWLQKSDLLTIGFTFPQCLWASFPHTARLCWAPSEPKGVHALGLLHLNLPNPRWWQDTNANNHNCAQVAAQSLSTANEPKDTRAALVASCLSGLFNLPQRK